MSAIVTQGLHEVTVEREARYLGDLAGCPGIAMVRDPVAIESTLQLEEVAAAWRA